MKKINISLLIILVSIITIVGFIGCKDPIHQHSFATDWSKDSTYHWKSATCEHSTQVSEKAKHNFGEWQVIKESSEETEGSKERTCTVCRYKATEVIAKLPHTHKFSEELTKDSKYHWYDTTCGHNEVLKKEEHTYTDGVCICGLPKDFVFIKGLTIDVKESLTPPSAVFIVGRKVTIQDLYVCNHEVTRGEYKSIMGNDPSTADAYDKYGNKLTGDAVLNNPVNGTNWYAAIVYCNKLSIEQNFTPCYSLNGKTNPDEWGDVPEDNNSTWNAVSCNWEANGYRLPTETEWEWIARGGEEYSYAGSDNLNDVAWHSTNPIGTREVKSKEPNGYGLYDMSGNVFEWCWDFNGKIESDTPFDGIISDVERIIRGGNYFLIFTDACRIAARSASVPYNTPYSGFRVVRSAN